MGAKYGGRRRDRVQIVLLAGEGLTNAQIVAAAGVNELIKRKWRDWFAEMAFRRA